MYRDIAAIPSWYCWYVMYILLASTQKPNTASNSGARIANSTALTPRLSVTIRRREAIIRLAFQPWQRK